MREFIFIPFLLILLGAPSFILSDVKPPKQTIEKVHLFASDVIVNMQQHKLNDIKQKEAEIETLIQSIEQQQTNIPKGENTPRWQNKHQRIREKAHERRNKRKFNWEGETIDIVPIELK